MPCPCGLEAEYDDCCGALIRGERQAETAEQLMRSRYSAYTQEEIDYVVQSHEPKGRDEVDREAALAWAKEADWLGLEILSTEAGRAGDEVGEVEFIAKYGAKGNEFKHHERAKFKRIDGCWYYVDGDIIKPKPVVREQPKVGRNEPCPCGSGRKYKKCCGAA